MMPVSAGGTAAQTGMQIARNSELISKLKNFNLKLLAEKSLHLGQIYTELVLLATSLTAVVSGKQ